MEVNPKLVTGKVRFSYAHVFEPQAIEEGNTPKFSVSVIIPKSDKKALNAIKAIVEGLTSEFLSKNNLKKLPSKFNLPLRDGDEDKPDDPAYEGCMFFNASSLRKPQVVDADLNPIMDKDEFYSGCYGRVSVNFYTFDKAGNRGIAAGLNNIQKLEDGVRLGGGSSAADDFGEDDETLM